MRRSYLGGVHPASYKESTRRKPIVPLEEAPKQVVIPLTMCSGGGALPEPIPMVKPTAWMIAMMENTIPTAPEALVLIWETK